MKREKLKLWFALSFCVAAGAAVAAGLGPQSYVQDGLVTHFDAFDNEGTGTHNPSGCIGSGTLGSAPASGTINATFPTTGDAPVKGEYALARFTSGGDLLAGWTVTLNGQSVDSAIVSGMKVEVQKDATGIWLKVQKPGVTIIVR